MACENFCLNPTEPFQYRLCWTGNVAVQGCKAIGMIAQRPCTVIRDSIELDS